MNYLLPLLSVLIGYGIALFLKPSSRSNLKLLLAFSGSFLLSLTVLHLLPDVYASTEDNLDGKQIGLCIMAGIVFQILLEFFSKGAEHGHVHVHGPMVQIPWLLFTSLCIHALFEGFPVSNHHDLAWGIAIHHLPIAIILTAFFLNAKLKPLTVFAFMLAFAVMTPLGTLVAATIPAAAEYSRPITAVVIGILIHISSTIIFESSENHKFNIAKVSVILVGIVIAVLL